MLPVFTLPTLAVGAVALPPTPRRPPNIVLIVTDDLGYGDLGCYGQRVVRTPNIDRLAAQGLRFTQFYSGATVCAPSRCALMTGLHSGHGTIRGNALAPLRPEDACVAQALGAAGYRTGLFGKWGLGEAGSTGTPNRKGFDEFYGYLNQVHAHDSFPAALWRDDAETQLPGNGQGAHGQFSNDLFTREAIGFVERNRNKPFFLYLAYTTPHANSSARRMDCPAIEPEYAGRGWPEAEARFASIMTRMDRDVGALVGRVDALGLGRETVILFTSDNGPHREGGHDPDFFLSRGGLRGIKRDQYEGGIRVPMIVRWLGHTPAGHVSAVPWAFWDFPATAAAMAGLQVRPAGDGISMLPAIRGKGQGRHPTFYWEFHEGGFHQAARTGDWKVVRHGLHAPVELYDLKRDRAEEHDLASEHPDIAARLGLLLDRSRTESTDFPVVDSARG